MERTGYVHIYCGDGKGKTTAAVGLAVRNAGRGGRTLIARFLKNDDSGEVAALALIPGIRVKPCRKTFGFFSSMTEEQKKEAACYYRELLEETWQEAESEGYDLLVLDEIMAAIHFGMADEAFLIEQIRKRPENLEVVLTGRNPSERLIGIADYVSEICKRKHPYDRGVTARKGIEL